MADAAAAVQRRALALAQVGRYAEAADLLRGLLAEQPDHVGALYQLAQCHRGLGQLAEAMRLVDQALGVTASQEPLLVEKARILLAAGRPEGAASVALHALEQDPRSWAAHGLLAQALLTLGNPTRVVLARRHADTALELAPELPDLHLLDARLHARMGRLRAAREACGQALALDPGYEPALRELALLDAGQDRTGRAARQLTAALAADPRRADGTAPVYEAVVAGLCWRFFDVLALAGLGQLVLFALLGPALGNAARPARLAVAVAVPLVVAGWAVLVWRRQPVALQGQLRRLLRSATVLTCLLLSLAVTAGLALVGFDPALGGPLLVPGYLVFAFRCWRQFRRRLAPVVRWLGYRVWSRLAARATIAVSGRPTS